MENQLNSLEEWEFNFGVYAPEDGAKVSYDQAEALMMTIIKHAEKHGLCIGGGFGPFKETE